MVPFLYILPLKEKKRKEKKRIRADQNEAFQVCTTKSRQPNEPGTEVGVELTSNGVWLPTRDGGPVLF